MTNKTIIITLVLILAAVLGFWLGAHSPWRAGLSRSQPVPAPMIQPPTDELAVQLEAELPCPDSTCLGRPVGQCTTKTARDMKRALRQLAQAGLPRETILRHLRMMGFLEG